ncbi:MAG TPA: isochorismatase family protein [Methylomirabilota bacterium]|jgi:nicotinamidase-related amidase|nr:isochorismatase family protein [Methylomirabilota bacterium]
MAETRRHAWEDLIDDDIRRIYANYGVRMGLRERPVLLCVDNYNAVFGDRPQPVLEAIDRFPSSCGEAAWAAIEPTRRLMAAAREVGIPVVHTTRDDSSGTAVSSLRSTKRTRYGADPAWGHAFFPQLAPEPGELVIRKTRASAFYGTPLEAHLVQRGVDTLIVCGNSTSGCVRATVLEGYMRGYAVAVVEECVFDRHLLSHKVNLFDMNAKYGDVMFLDEVLDYVLPPSGGAQRDFRKSGRR